MRLQGRHNRAGMRAHLLHEEWLLRLQETALAHTGAVAVTPALAADRLRRNGCYITKQLMGCSGWPSNSCSTATHSS
jgi:hypothetical protein